MVDISFYFSTGGIFSFYLSSESDFPLFSWRYLETDYGDVSGGVIMSIVSASGVDPVGGGWGGVSVFDFSS